MSAEIDPPLLAQVEEAEGTGPERQLPVIVTTEGTVAAAELEAAGLAVDRVVERISCVCGRIRAGDVRKPAAVERVRRIEFDSEMYAL